MDQKFYPSLNGLRAISIIMVLIHHFILMYNGYFQNLLFIGPLGVNVFFVISGFLITTLCIKEKVKTKKLSLRSFYFRRALRILPLAYLYIIVIVILNYIFNLDISAVSIFSSVFFVANLSYFKKLKFDWGLAHYWSLSVEEQFYLFFPFFIKKNMGLFVTLLLFICFAVPPLVYVQSISLNFNFGLLSAALRYLTKFQGIAVGCLASVLFFKGYFRWGKINFIITLISIFCMFYLKFEAAFSLTSCFSNLAISIFTCFVVINNIQYQDNLVYKLLNLRILNLIGILSYSIYIWQQLFMSNDPKFVLSKYPINLIFLIGVPLLSYFCYERFFLKFKSSYNRGDNIKS